VNAKTVQFSRDRPGSRLVRQTSNSAVAGLPIPTADAPSSFFRSAVKFSARDSSAHVKISVYLQSSTTIKLQMRYGGQNGTPHLTLRTLLQATAYSPGPADILADHKS
jgi:hypothetical protein